MNYSAACESARNSPRKTLANPRVSRNSPPHHGNPSDPPLAQHTLREMRCVLHLNAGHLELSGCVPSFFRTSFTISRSGKLRRGSFLSWSRVCTSISGNVEKLCLQGSLYTTRNTTVWHVKKIFNIFWWRIFRDVEEVCLLIVIEDSRVINM